jgi:hypothetical protein
MRPIFSSILAFLGIAGCQPSVPRDDPSIKELIESYKDAPIGESIDDISRGLAQCEVLMPTEGVHQPGKPLSLKVSHDNQSRVWAYAYTDEAELLAAFPKGSPFVQMKFRDALGVVAQDSRFGGVFINHTEKYMYLIPREAFARVQAELDAVVLRESETER